MISQKFKGKNFMPPHVIEYGETDDYIYELSNGKFVRDYIYGVTVLNKDGSRTEGLSTCFDTLEEAETYIQTL